MLFGVPSTKGKYEQLSYGLSLKSRLPLLNYDVSYQGYPDESGRAATHLTLALQVKSGVAGAVITTANGKNRQAGSVRRAVPAGSVTRALFEKCVPAEDTVNPVVRRRSTQAELISGGRLDA